MKLLSACVLFIAFSSFANQFSKPLPNWIDHSREIQQRCVPSTENIEPPPSFRLPAEYEPAQAVAISYSGYEPMLREISKIVTTEGEAQVWMSSTYAPQSIPGVPAEKYELSNCPVNTVWVRDYGPVGIVENTGALAIVDSRYRHEGYRCQDDEVPSCLANAQGVSAYPMNLILDGGNLMVDSKGNLFMTKRTYIWNSGMTKEQVDQRLKSFYNVHTIHAIDYAGYPGSPMDGTGHIDMFVKLLNDETVLIADSNSAGFKEAIQKAVQYFQTIKTPAGNSYKIVRSPGWASGRTWYTYTNSLIVNNVVIIPSFAAYKDKEAIAVAAYQDGMPNIKVKPVLSDDSIHAGGSIHCVTQLIPKIK